MNLDMIEDTIRRMEIGITTFLEVLFFCMSAYCIFLRFLFNKILIVVEYKLCLNQFISRNTFCKKSFEFVLVRLLQKVGFSNLKSRYSYIKIFEKFQFLNLLLILWIMYKYSNWRMCLKWCSALKSVVS